MVEKGCAYPHAELRWRVFQAADDASPFFEVDRSKSEGHFVRKCRIEGAVYDDPRIDGPSSGGLDVRALGGGAVGAAWHRRKAAAATVAATLDEELPGLQSIPEERAVGVRLRRSRRNSLLGAHRRIPTVL
jgi:hypothetical protein